MEDTSQTAPWSCGQPRPYSIYVVKKNSERWYSCWSKLLLYVGCIRLLVNSAEKNAFEIIRPRTNFEWNSWVQYYKIDRQQEVTKRKGKEGADLGREVADDIGLVAAPEGGGALLAEDAGEGVGDALVGVREVTAAEHLGLVLQQQLDALDRCGPRLGHDRGGAAHGEVRRHRGRRPGGPQTPLLPLGRGGGGHY